MLVFSVPQIDLITTWYRESTKIKLNQIGVNNKNITQIGDLLVPLPGVFIAKFYWSLSDKVTTSSYQNESFYIQLFNWISSLQWNSLQLLSLLIALFRPTMEEETHLLKSFEGSHSKSCSISIFTSLIIQRRFINIKWFSYSTVDLILCIRIHFNCWIEIDASTRSITMIRVKIILKNIIIPPNESS